jgi:hypothetical protein
MGDGGPVSMPPEQDEYNHCDASSATSWTFRSNVVLQYNKASFVKSDSGLGEQGLLVQAVRAEADIRLIKWIDYEGL